MLLIRSWRVLRAKLAPCGKGDEDECHLVHDMELPDHVSFDNPQDIGPDEDPDDEVPGDLWEREGPCGSSTQIGSEEQGSQSECG